MSDFVGGIASRRVAALRVVLVSYPVALVLLAGLAAITGGDISQGAILWGGLCGISQAFGVWWFYAALGAGPISVVSPLTAVLVAAIPVGVGLALGERPGAIAAVGVVLALAAVVLVSREATDEDVTPHRFTTKVAWLTVGAGIAFGLNFVLIAQAPVEAKLWPLVFARLAATVLVFAVAALSGNLRLPSGTPLRLAVLAAVLDVVANIA
ncbi:MAG: EamA family transporter, partial [Mycobacterium sp.]